MEEPSRITSLPTLLRPSMLHKRTRNSCLRCQHRKIRCTRERPQCHNCVRLNHVCQYETPPQAQQEPSRLPTFEDSSAGFEWQSSVAGSDAARNKPDPNYESVLERLGKLERALAQLVGGASSQSTIACLASGGHGAADCAAACGMNDEGSVSGPSGNLGCALADVDQEPQYRSTSHWSQIIEEV